MAKQPTAPASTAGVGRVVAVVLAALVALPAPVLVSLYRAEVFDPAAMPEDYSDHTASVPERHGRVLGVSERVGEGLLPGPEDMAYDAGSGFLYTGCDDGWIRRVKLPEGDEEATAEVEDWVQVGGRPLGLAFGPDQQLLVADAYKGLLAVAGDGTVRLLADEAEGVRFGLTDGVDVASDGTVYFTDASYKYNLSVHMLDTLEGRPYGRLMGFDPAANKTTVLLRDLYFANGVALFPDQASLVYCETILRRCRRYHIRGEKKGTVERFLDDLPGYPDNIRYDGEGHFWIGLPAGKSRSWDVVMKYPWVRKMMVVAMKKYVSVPHSLKGSGVLRASLQGEPLSLYTDPALELVTGGLKIGRHLYYGSLVRHYFSRIRLDKLAASSK